jgi:hypothetical protein
LNIFCLWLVESEARKPEATDGTDVDLVKLAQMTKSTN